MFLKYKLFPQGGMAVRNLYFSLRAAYSLSRHRTQISHEKGEVIGAGISIVGTATSYDLDDRGVGVEVR
jgi:hypothetical protein